MHFRHLAILSLCFIFACTTLSSFYAQPASAAFNQSNIIDNSIFDNSQTMTANDIQNFLNGFPNSCLSNYSSPYPTGYSAYGANVSAATVIKRASDLWGINPQVILTTLEKEQSLVSGNVGCAGWQYNSAMGMGCPDSGPCPAPQYSGFSQQVTKGSWQLMFARERAEGITSWDDDGAITYSGFMTAGYRARVAGGTSAYYDGYATIDGASVYMSNGATASLYTYTPHFHGNQNFVLIFEKWFGTAHGTFLLQSPQSPAVYLMSGTTRYGIPSWGIMKAYGFDKIKVTPVTDQYMNSLTDGGTLGLTFMQEGSHAVYFADNGYRFGFSTYTQCVNWGFPNCLSTMSSKSLSPYIFNTLLNGGDMKSLMLNGSSVYLMENGQRRQLLSGKAMQENGFTNSDIIPVTEASNITQPLGFSIPENNSFITFKSNPVIYIYSGGLFYPINSYDLFSSIIPPNTIVFNDSSSLYNVQPPTPQQPLSSIMSTASGAKTYLFTSGKKYDITANASDWPTAASADVISSVIDQKPISAVTGTNSTYQTPQGYIFRISGSQTIPFYSVDDFFKSIYTKQPLIVDQSVINTLPVSNPVIARGGGSVYQVTTPGKESLVYTMNNDGSSCTLSSLAQLSGFKLNTSNVHRISEFMPTGSQLNGFTKSSSGLFYIVRDGTKISISPSVANLWSINTSSSCTFTDDFLSSLSTSPMNKTFVFARLPNGVIYYPANGSMHPVLSYSSFLKLGGSSANTIDVTSDFASYASIGDPIY